MQNFYITGSKISENTEFWKSNSERDYVNCIQNIIKSKPFGDHKFYIFSFVKRVDDATGVKKMYHQPRLTKPDPIAGTTLMRVDPNDPENAILIWTLPNEENFGLYKYGKIFADPFVHECIDNFINNPRRLMQPCEGDLTDDEIWQIYKEKEHKRVRTAALKKRGIVDEKKAQSSLT